MQDKNVFQETYLRAAGAVAFVCVEDAEGQEGIGSAFHIGGGIFVTAAHVVKDLKIKEIATTKSPHLGEEAKGQIVPPRRFKLVEGPYYGPPMLDVAVFKVDLGGMPLPAIKVSQHTDFTLKENDLILSDVLIIGYPPIPFTTVASQVVTLGQINSVVRVRHSPAIHFIASAMARGGFSGGVALDQSGCAIGLVTESLGSADKVAELGFMGLLSIEPAVDLAVDRFGFEDDSGNLGRYSDTLFGANFSNPVDRPLSSFIYDASVFVYDDDRHVFVEIKCNDEALVTEAAAAFNAVTPVARQEVEDVGILYTPLSNPPAAVLLDAAEAAAALFVSRGYRMMPAERSQWQLKQRSYG